MRSLDEVRSVRALVARGLNDCEIARETGIPRGTIRDWRHGHGSGAARVPDDWTACPRCGHRAHDFQKLPTTEYAYLLGMYLGDGYLAAHRRGVYALRITLDARYPGIIAEAVRAMAAVLPGKRPYVQDLPIGAKNVCGYSKQWPCLFPQHGRGPKHQRPIRLTSWQQRIVDAEARSLIRGLIHSDGCRFTNAVKHGARRYEYPRYNFTNASADIRAIFCQACDRVGVEWRRMNERNISIAKRESVARLDEFVGPKR
jgi:hypothetical protein